MYDTTHVGRHAVVRSYKDTTHVGRQAKLRSYSASHVLCYLNIGSTIMFSIHYIFVDIIFFFMVQRWMCSFVLLHSGRTSWIVFFT